MDTGFRRYDSERESVLQLELILHWMDTDVLIVGAGPTGLMLANQLVRRGVRALIIDRHPGPSLQTRALGVQARTLEIYAQLGIDERALELGKRGTGANIWAQGRRMARVPLGEAGAAVTPYPFILILGQDDNERIMGDKLRAPSQPATQAATIFRLVPSGSLSVAVTPSGSCSRPTSSVSHCTAMPRSRSLSPMIRSLSSWPRMRMNG